jgi:hypothetical protein
VDRKVLEHIGFQGTFVLLSRMDPSHRYMNAQGHHSCRWTCYQGSQRNTCRTLGGRSASISTSIPIS